MTGLHVKCHEATFISFFLLSTFHSLKFWLCHVLFKTISACVSFKRVRIDRHDFSQKRCHSFFVFWNLECIRPWVLLLDFLLFFVSLMFGFVVCGSVFLQNFTITNIYILHKDIVCLDLACSIFIIQCFSPLNQYTLFCKDKHNFHYLCQIEFCDTEVFLVLVLFFSCW